MASPLPAFAPLLQPTAAASMTPNAAPVVVAHPIQAALTAGVLEAGEVFITEFVEQIDSAVQALLGESRNAGETRAALDLGQALAVNRPALVRGFLTALKRRFNPLLHTTGSGVVDLERLCLLPAEEMEEGVVLSRLALLVTERTGGQGRALAAQLQSAARDLSLPALADALAAGAMPTCFKDAFIVAGLAAEERVLAYRLVESHALARWSQVLARAQQVLAQQGLQAQQLMAAPAPAQDLAPVVSAATVQTLREARASLVSGADGALAHALLRALEPPQAARNDAGLIVALAGAWIDGLMAEPELPAAFAPDLESLRLVIIKATICDPSFFTQELHPVRKAVDELLQKAAFTGLQGYSLATLRLELKDVSANISIHGQFALDALFMLPPLEPDLAQQFALRQQQDRELRREGLLARVRALATREIDARTLDVSLPTAARAALARGFLPLLSTLMLRYGSSAPRTRQARQLLERFVDSFALCVGLADRQAVTHELCDILLDVGLPDLHVNGVISELEKAYAELEEEAQSSLPSHDNAGTLREINDILAGIGNPSPNPNPNPLEVTLPFVMPRSAVTTPSPSPMSVPAVIAAPLRTPPGDVEPLTLLLKPGQWFRVRDYKRGDDRWLSLAGVHREQDRVSFSGFDGVTVMAMRATQFIEDLTSGLAEPLNPEPLIQQALYRLRARPATEAERLRSFG